MTSTLLKVSALRKLVHSRGRRLSTEFLNVLEADIRNKVIAACNVHNGSSRKLDATVAGHVGILRSAALILFLGLALSASAMGRWEALSQVESGDNDFAIGTAGEVSRYQIMPAVWQAETENLLISQNRNSLHKPDAQDAADANTVAWLIMVNRTFHFWQTHRRSPTDAEWYLLWSCPAKVDHPSHFKAEVAARFANLCARGPIVGQGEKQNPKTATSTARAH